MRACCQRPVGPQPGSSNTGSSKAPPASASSTDTDKALHASARKSVSASTCAAGACSVSPNIARPSALVLIEPAFQVVNGCSALDELGVDHQLAVERDIGMDALDHGFRKRRAHARLSLIH